MSSDNCHLLSHRTNSPGPTIIYRRLHYSKNKCYVNYLRSWYFKEALETCRLFEGILPEIRSQEEMMETKTVIKGEIL